MLGGTASAQFSTGHTVDTKGTSSPPPLPEKNPSVLQAECVGAWPALPATEMSFWTVLCLLAFSYTHIKGAVYKEAKGMS